MKKVIFITAGFLFLGIAVIGVALPILPTTPFLLIAAACFTKGSKHFQDWFTSTKLYQRHLEAFVRGRAMTLKSKIKVCAMASVMLLIAFFVMHNIYGRICIVCVILFKYYYFTCRIRTIKVKNKTETMGISKKAKEA